MLVLFCLVIWPFGLYLNLPIISLLHIAFFHYPRSMYMAIPLWHNNIAELSW